MKTCNKSLEGWFTGSCIPFFDFSRNFSKTQIKHLTKKTMKTILTLEIRHFSENNLQPDEKVLVLF